MVQFSFPEVETVVRRLAGHAFARCPDRHEKTADAVSVAWEWFSTAPDSATPRTLALYAIRQVKVRRQFRESVRSLGSPKTRYRDKLPDTDFDLSEIAAVGGDPAETAAFRIDFPAWVQTLDTRQQGLLQVLAVGEVTSAVAAMFGLTAGRVSQIRRELANLWERFHGEP